MVFGCHNCGVYRGIVDFGGPLPDVVYRCFEWEACEIEALDGSSLSDLVPSWAWNAGCWFRLKEVGYGGSISGWCWCWSGWMMPWTFQSPLFDDTWGDGDRLLVVPDGTNCLDFTPGLFQQGFPLNGVSLPATHNGTRYSWGSGLVRASVGYYALCWCSNADADPNATVSVCSEAGPFTVPGGVIRIGSSKEFQFINNGGEFLGWNGGWGKVKISKIWNESWCLGRIHIEKVKILIVLVRLYHWFIHQY